MADENKPAAWATFFPNGSTHSVFVDGHRTPSGAVPLYRQQPTLTPEERMAVAWAVDAASNDEHPAEDILRGLLARCAIGSVERNE